MLFQKPIFVSLLLKILFSLIAAHVVVTIGEERSIFQLMFLKAYHVALGSSTIISFLVLQFISMTYSFLDQWFPWGYLNLMRLLMIVSFCFSFPLLFAFVLAAYYYHLHNLNIFQTGYFLYVFKLLVSYIIGINIYYNKEWFYYVWFTEKLESGTNNGPTPEILVDAGENDLSLKNIDIAMVFIQTRTCLAKNSLNEDILWPYNSIRKSLMVLPKDKYLLVKRDLILRVDLIKNIKRLPNRKLILTLHPPFSQTIAISKYKKGAICSFGAKYIIQIGGIKIKGIFGNLFFENL